MIRLDKGKGDFLKPLFRAEYSYSMQEAVLYFRNKNRWVAQLYTTCHGITVPL